MDTSEIVMMEPTTQRAATHTSKILVCIALCMPVVACASGNAHRSAVQQLGVTVRAANAATAYANSLPQGVLLHDDQMRKLRSLWGDALLQAKKIDVAAINRDVPGFGDKVSSELIGGLDECSKATSTQALLHCQSQLDHFGDDLSAARQYIHAHPPTR